jgi:hypothetical protein
MEWKNYAMLSVSKSIRNTAGLNTRHAFEDVVGSGAALGAASTGSVVPGSPAGRTLELWSAEHDIRLGIQS